MDFATVLPRLTKPLSIGSHGPEVKTLQEALNGWDEDQVQQLVVDGRFGKKTYYAVRFVQFWEKLKEDGVVGPKTAEVLGLEMSSGPRMMPVSISIDQPPPPAMTPPLKLLVDVIVEGLRPLKERIEDAILSAPKDSDAVKAIWQHRNQANEGFDDLADDLASWAKDPPEGNLAAAKLRMLFQAFVQWTKSELEASQFYARGGWIWRFKPVLDQLPVELAAGVTERVLRGEQTAVVAMAQIRLAFENFNRALQQVPRMDANGVGPDGKPT